MAAKEAAKSLPVAAVVPCLARQSRPGCRCPKPWHQASLSSCQAQGAAELTHGHHGSPPRFTFAEAGPSSSRDPELMEPNSGCPGKGSSKLPTGGPQASQVQAGKPCRPGREALCCPKAASIPSTCQGTVRVGAPWM